MKRRKKKEKEGKKQNFLFFLSEEKAQVEKVKQKKDEAEGERKLGAEEHFPEKHGKCQRKQGARNKHGKLLKMEIEKNRKQKQKNRNRKTEIEKQKQKNRNRKTEIKNRNIEKQKANPVELSSYQAIRLDQVKMKQLA